MVCPTADQDLVWACITDNQKLNFYAGMGPLKLRPLDNFTAARFTVSTRQGGFTVVYDEEPYEWVEHQYARVTRRFSRGPIRLYQMQFQLPESTQTQATEVLLRTLIMPWQIWLQPIIYLSTKLALIRLGRAINKMPEISGRSAGSMATKVPHGALFRKLAHALPRCGNALVDRFIDYLGAIDDVSASSLRPYPLAQAWKLEHADVLALFLLGSLDGALNPRWSPTCPSCRAEVTPLDRPARKLRCQLCDITLPQDLQVSHQLVFSADKSVRSVNLKLFSPGGAQRTPHVSTQKVMLSYGRTVLRVSQVPGHYILGMRGGVQVPLEVSAQAVVYSYTLATTSLPTSLFLAPGCTISIDNPEPYARHVKIERAEKIDLAVRLSDIKALVGEGELGLLCKHLAEQLESQSQLPAAGAQ